VRHVEIVVEIIDDCAARTIQKKNPLAPTSTNANMSLSASFAGGAAFAFQKRQGRINWRRIGEVDLKRLISEVRL
jgi:hypothetical protein